MARLVVFVLLVLGCSSGAAAQRAPARPTFAVITSLAEGMGLHHVAVHGAPLPYGTPQRFVAVVSSSARPVTSQDDVRDVTLLVIERSGTAFGIQSSISLPVAPRPNMYEDRRGRDFTIATWRAEDVDADGELELVMVLRWIVAVVCGPGQIWQSQLIVVDLVPRASIALSFALESFSESGIYEFRGHVTHEDRNGDGHPDVRARFRDCDRDAEDTERCGAPRYVDYLWDPARDAFGVSAPPAASVAPCEGG